MTFAVLPTVRVDRLERLLGIAEIAKHNRAPSEADLALALAVAAGDVLETCVEINQCVECTR